MKFSSKRMPALVMFNWIASCRTTSGIRSAGDITWSESSKRISGPYPRDIRKRFYKLPADRQIQAACNASALYLDQVVLLIDIQVPPFPNVALLTVYGGQGRDSHRHGERAGDAGYRHVQDQIWTVGAAVADGRAPHVAQDLEALAEIALVDWHGPYGAQITRILLPQGLQGGSHARVDQRVVHAVNYN